MLKKEDLQEIKELEEEGISVVAVDSEGKLSYATQGIGGSEYCDQCSAFKLLPDPDPFDWFRYCDMKAVCTKMNGVIKGALERPSEYINIRKPLYCPKLGRKLSSEEEKEAIKDLEWARKRMGKR